MMQALLQQQLGPSFIVESAGIWREGPGAPANARSVLLMKERGIDLTAHISRWTGDLRLTDYSHIICVDEEVADKMRAHLPPEAGTTVIIANGDGGGIRDPYELGLDGYRACLALLDEAIPVVASTIRNSA